MMTNLGLGFMAQPGSLRHAILASAPPTPNEFGLRIIRNDGTSYLDTSIERVTAAAEKGVRWFLGGDAMRLAPMYLTVWLDNEINRTDLKPKRHMVPELEFIRHLRNASGHGNVFHFERGQPKRSAHFKSFEISSDLEGAEAFFSFIGPGDFLELLDTTAALLKLLP